MARSHNHEVRIACVLLLLGTVLPLQSFAHAYKARRLPEHVFKHNAMMPVALKWFKFQTDRLAPVFA
jgi:hypothetical protein